MPGPAEVGRILGLAAKSGLRYIDTAAEYGESEAALGRALRELPANRELRVVTKTVKLAPGATAPEAEIESAFVRSCTRLGLPSVYGLLVHQASDLSGATGERVFAALANLKAKGFVAKIGASVYRPAEALELTTRFPFDLIQIPVSLFDQRFLADGLLAKLKSRGIEIHARSVFLQGLLLMDPETVDPYFQPIVPRLRELRAAIRAAGMSPLAAALGFVDSLRGIDALICGVTSAAELEELIASYKNSAPLADPAAFAVAEEAYVNPALWRLSR